jgi:XapX domain-containing protein
MIGYLVSLIMGLAVGVAYGLVQVRSPAPPLIALIGLLGMVLGEQAIEMAKRHFAAPQASIGEVLDDVQTLPNHPQCPEFVAAKQGPTHDKNCRNQRAPARGFACPPVAEGRTARRWTVYLVDGG